MSKQLAVPNNPGMVEIEKVVAQLYVQKLITKDDIKELINSLKLLASLLPDTEIIHTH